ncbi:class II aldolase/adducin family protein [Cupriavidus nantongensis]|uniref:class II aldolase/adducin family protein n=1 Tax=Cupriavidus nantongensis TaxID=1796606 RepID=UPI00224629D9|nr:class II aldolase/adducin family protein [Cupriavidus nantongensis]
MSSSAVRANVSPAEWQTRVDLAAAYRLVALYGWDDLVFTHLSARIPGTESFLINPYGMMFDEITASSLVKIDLAGNKLAPSPYDINPAGFTIHSAVHAARADAGCVMHTHSLNGIAVSAQAEGLLPLSQQSQFILPALAYHDYEGIAVNADEKPRLVRDLGGKHVMLLRNHGLLALGTTIADAFVALYFAEAACAIQVRAQAGGGALRPISGDIQQGIAAQARVTTLDLGPDRLVWPGLLRRLDRRNPGYAD